MTDQVIKTGSVEQTWQPRHVGEGKLIEGQQCTFPQFNPNTNVQPQHYHPVLILKGWSSLFFSMKTEKAFKLNSDLKGGKEQSYHRFYSKQKF